MKWGMLATVYLSIILYKMIFVKEFFSRQGNSIYFLEDKFLFTQIKLVLFVGTGVLLRFGHARALTTIRVVIHSPYAASLPRLSA